MERGYGLPAPHAADKRCMIKQLENEPETEIHMPAPIHFSHRALQTADQPISYFMQQAVENPNLISLAAGLVDQESLPAAEVAAAAAELLQQPKAGRAALQYGTSRVRPVPRSSSPPHARA
jgi:2-aminoadipate transaminase